MGLLCLQANILVDRPLIQIEYTNTVPATSVATKPNLCTKQPIFNELV